MFLDLPGDSVVKNLPTNARDMGLIPSPGRFQHAKGQQTCMPQLLKLICPRAYDLQWEKPPQLEVCALQLESSLHSPQLEKVHEQQWRANTASDK